MRFQRQFDDDWRRRIFEYVEKEGAVDPEQVRQNVLVRPETHSKPARSGSGLEPSVPMSREEFTHHVSILERDGYLKEEGGKLRITLPVETEARAVEFDGVEATVRPARQEDITGIIGVIETVASDETYVVAARLAEEVSREGVLVRHNESEDRTFFVATVDDDAVGWLHVEGSQFPRMDHTAELTIGVLERYRGNGLGSALMQSGLDWARERDYRKVYQNLPATNESAIEFLRNHDWSVEATRRGHYRIGDELADEVQLAIWLEEA